jgi:hypothetical protein
VKTIFLSVVLFGLTFCATAQIETNQPARFQNKVISYEGKIGSGVSSSSMLLAPDGNYPGNISSNTVTSPGHESKLEWVFIGRNGSKDVYLFTFTRKMKKDSSSQTTTSKEVQFVGKKVIVFEDELHCVVMESPSAEDLKKAQGH